MNSKSNEILLELLTNYKLEYNDLKSLITGNHNRISEIEGYIQSFLSKEDSSYKMFSPRNVESVYKEEFEKLRAEEDFLNESNAEYTHKLEVIQQKIDQIEEIINIEREIPENRVGHFDPSVPISNFSIIKIQEKERQRIARDLHDTSLQNLAYLIHKIELSGMYIEQDPLRAKLELSVITKNMRDIIDEIRNTIFNLRPMTFDDLGIKTAFERILEKFNEKRTYIIDTDIDDVSCENDLVMGTLYHIVRESLLNIEKHAEADRILFHCKVKNNFYHITIEDNGKGFTEDEIEEKKNKHFGLSLLKERTELLGGTINVRSKKDKGTRINIDIPMKDIFVRTGEEYGY